MYFSSLLFTESWELIGTSRKPSADKTQTEGLVFNCFLRVGFLDSKISRIQLLDLRLPENIWTILSSLYDWIFTVMYVTMSPTKGNLGYGLYTKKLEKI